MQIYMQPELNKP